MAVLDGALAVIVSLCSARSAHPFMRAAPRALGRGDWRPTAPLTAAGQGHRWDGHRGAVGRPRFARGNVA